MGYTDQEGIAIESNYKRLNFRANVESKVLNRITVGVNLAPSASWNEGGRVDGKDRQATNVLTMLRLQNLKMASIPVQELTATIVGPVPAKSVLLLYGTCTKQRRKGAIKLLRLCQSRYLEWNQSGSDRFI